MGVSREPVFRICDLHTEFRQGTTVNYAVNGAGYEIFPGEIVGLVGESGCGKSVLQYSALRIFPRGTDVACTGQVCFKGRDLLDPRTGESELRALRGGKIAMVFQDPVASLDPLMPVGEQIAETIRTHLTRVQRLLSHCAYSITQALDEAHFLEKVTLPPGPGEHPPLSAKTQTAMYLMLAAFFFAGLAAPAAFFLECIPVYFIFLRKTTAQGRRPTQEAEDLLAQWNGYFSFVDGMCGLYRQQAETISADEWARAIPYLLTSGQWSRWLEEFPLICADTADPSREPPCFVSRFYRRDAAGTLSPIPELPHFFKQFEAACIYVFYADKSGQVDFDFRAFSSYSGS